LRAALSAWHERSKGYDMSTITTKDGTQIYYNMVNEDLPGFLKT
jgi:hypothetical protein